MKTVAQLIALLDAQPATAQNDIVAWKGDQWLWAPVQKYHTYDQPGNVRPKIVVLRADLGVSYPKPPWFVFPWPFRFPNVLPLFLYRVSGLSTRLKNLGAYWSDAEVLLSQNGPYREITGVHPVYNEPTGLSVALWLDSNPLPLVPPAVPLDP